MSSFLHKQQHIELFSTQLDIIPRHDPATEQVRKYISDIYSKNYQATISPDPDFIVVNRDRETGQILACSGVSFRSLSKNLFSERYLDTPICEAILTRTQSTVTPQQIIEIGSLASDNPTAAADLIRLMPIIAWFMGSKAILCTSTQRLRKLFNYHQIPFSFLNNASAELLSPSERVAWGTYYDQSPQTGVILLEECGHLFNHFCGRVVFSEFEKLSSLSIPSAQVAA